MNFMNDKIKAPFAGDLQLAVDRLPDILVPVDLLAGKVDEARAARRVAQAALTAAKEALAKVPHQRVGAELSPAIVSAREAVIRAEAHAQASMENFGRARDRRQEAFAREAAAQIEQAAPTLLEVVRVLNDAITPLAGLHYHAAVHQLPMPRLLAMVPTLQDATRIMTAIANAATAPAEGKDSNND